jgi:hypothetical protein
MNVIWIYLGPGFIPGVPARDLTREDWELLEDSLKEAVRVSGLYREVQVKPQEDRMARPKYERKEG